MRTETDSKDPYLPPQQVEGKRWNRIENGQSIGMDCIYHPGIDTWLYLFPSWNQKQNKEVSVMMFCPLLCCSGTTDSWLSLECVVFWFCLILELNSGCPVKEGWPVSLCSQAIQFSHVAACGCCALAAYLPLIRFGKAYRTPYFPLVAC